KSRRFPSVQVVVPALWSARDRPFCPAPSRVMLPLQFVVPDPSIVPADHDVRPLTLTVSDPVSVPFDSVRVATLIVSPLEKSAVPPETSRLVPTLVTVPVKCAAPEGTFVAPVTL